MDSARAPPGDLERLAHDLLQAPLVDLPHGERPQAPAPDVFPLGRIQVPHAHDRDVFRSHGGGGDGNGGHRLVAFAEQVRERHAMHVAGVGRGRSIDVAVGIQPDEAQALLPDREGGGHSRHGTGGQGVIAAQHERRPAIADGPPGLHGQPYAHFRDGGEEWGGPISLDRFPLQHYEVADVLHLVAECLEPGLQLGNAQGGGPHVDATAAGTQVHGDADDADAGHWVASGESV